MRVLMVGHQYWPVAGSGSQVLGALTAQLRAKDVEVTVITSAPGDGGPRRRTGPCGERVLCVGPAEGTANPVRRLFNLVLFAGRIVSSARVVDFDVVVSDPPPTAAFASLLVARRRRVPFVYYLADSWRAAAEGARQIWLRALTPVIGAVEDYTLRHASSVLAATPGMARVAATAGAADSVTTIPNGIPTDVYTPDGEQWWPNGKHNPFFVYAGNAGVVHGAEIFARAAEERWRAGEVFDLVYLGYGSDSELINDIASRWPDRVHCRGSVSAATVAAATRTAVASLASLRPSTGYADARPIKAMSGLACGTPLIYAGSGDFADLLAQADLAYVSPWDVSAVQENLVRALLDATQADADERARRVAFARENFDDRIPARIATEAVLRPVSG